MKKIFLPVVLLVAAVVLFSTGCDDEKTTEPAPAAWYTEVVDSLGRTGVATSIAVDQAGLPHIVYFNEFAPYYLKYAYFNGSSWEQSVVDADVRVEDFTQATILIDGAGNPHIGYGDGASAEIYYAHQLVGGWQIDTVDRNSQQLRSPSMALDRSQRPIFAYGKALDTSFGLFVAGLSDEVWEHELVFLDTLGPLFHTEVAVDTGGTVHIAFTAHEGLLGYDLLYAVGEGASWAIDTVVGDGQAGQYCSLDLTADGAPRIAFRAVDPDAVGYAALSGSAWVIETFDTTATGSVFDPARYPESIAMALGADETPHIAYWRWSDSSLAYAVHSGQWMIERADSEGVVGTYCDIAVDSEGRPHMSYRDRDNQDLKYAVKR